MKILLLFRVSRVENSVPQPTAQLQAAQDGVSLARLVGAEAPAVTPCFGGAALWKAPAKPKQAEALSADITSHIQASTANEQERNRPLGIVTETRIWVDFHLLRSYGRHAGVPYSRLQPLCRQILALL